MYLSLKPPEQLLESLISLGKEKKKVSPLKERNKNGHISHEAFKICGYERTKSPTQLPSKLLSTASRDSGDTCRQPGLNLNVALCQLLISLLQVSGLSSVKWT